MLRKNFWRVMTFVMGVLLCFSLFLLHQQEQLIQETLQDAQRATDLCSSYSARITEYQAEIEELSSRCKSQERELSKFSHMVEPVYVLSRGDIELLAKVVQCEAGPSVSVSGKPINTEAQKYITKVILNRVISPTFPDNVHDVVYQKNQFSVVDLLDSVEVEPGTLLNVYDVLFHNGADDLPSYVCFFYSEKVKGGWINTLPVFMTHEGTVYAYDEREV